MNSPIKISGNDEGIRLERYIQKYYPQVPRAVRQKFFRKKKIAVFRKGKRLPLEQNILLKKDDELKIFFNLEEFGEKKEGQKLQNFDAVLRNQKLKKIEIIYQDEYFFIIKKPAGVAVHPGSKVRFGHSAIDYMIAFVRSKNSDSPEPKLVHRLDKDTSGLLIVAKNDAVLRKLTEIIRKNQIKKYYYALVRGSFQKKQGSITTALERTEGSKFTKITASEKGKKSITHYNVKQYFPDKNASLVEILLETGRMHQIRVHFADKGHPLAGDQAYGNFSWNKELQKKYQLKRQFLHAYKLEFTHPVTSKKLKIQIDLEDDLIKVVYTNLK